MPPYELPQQKTKSVIKTSSSKGGGGSNEIRFEDLKGEEQLLLFSQRDLHVRTNRDRVENVDRDHHLTVARNKVELVNETRNTEVKLNSNEKIGGNLSLAGTGDVAEKFGGNHCEQAGAIYLKGATDVVIEAGASLTLKVGGNFVKVDAGGITIMGAMVKINSAGGSAGNGTIVAPEAPLGPLVADTVGIGRDVTYEQDGRQSEGEAPPPVETTTSWIEIELVDEIGRPVPGEKYAVLDASGEIIADGHLDDQGLARAQVPEKTTHQITFPNLDALAWETQ